MPKRARIVYKVEHREGDGPTSPSRLAFAKGEIIEQPDGDASA